MSDVVIRVENLSKEYRLGTISHGTLRQDLQSWWARIRGKEDPNPDIESCHCERSEAISHFSAEIATHPSGTPNDTQSHLGKIPPLTGDKMLLRNSHLLQGNCIP